MTEWQFQVGEFVEFRTFKGQHRAGPPAYWLEAFDAASERSETPMQDAGAWSRGPE